MWRKFDRALLPTFIAGAVGFAATPAAAVDKDCALEASGEACVYDIAVTAAPAGATINLCSIPGKAGARLRNTTARFGTIGAVSNVGTTAAGACSGPVSQPVVAGGKYEAIVTYETPLSAAFPRSAKARISASSGVAFTVSGRRPQAFVEPQTCSQISESLASPAADVDTAVCGGLYKCAFNPSGDQDQYRWTVPAGTVGWLRIAGPVGAQWCLYKPDGSLDNNRCVGGDGLTSILPAGTQSIITSNAYNYTGEYYLSVQGVSGAHRCGAPIACGDVRSSTLATPADSDTFRLTTSASTLILNITGPVGTNWCVFNGAGVRLLCDDSATVPLPAAGTYLIGVYNAYNYTGAYNLSVNCLP